MLIAGYTAKNLSDYQSRLALLLPDALAHEAQEIVGRLYPAFEKWWIAEGEPRGGSIAARIGELIGSTSMRSEINAMHALFGNPTSAKQIARVHLMFRPGKVDTSLTSGANMGVESYAEMIDGASAKERMQIIVHEYAHFVFGAVTRKDAQALRDRLFETDADLGATVWSQLNEGLATALGNGRVARLYESAEAFATYRARPNSFYNDPVIDAVGKTLLPIVDEAIRKQTSIFAPTFAAEVLAALRAQHAALLSTPAARLREVKIVIPPALGMDMMRWWQQDLRANSIWGDQHECCDAAFEKAISEPTGITRVIVVPMEKVPQLRFLSAQERAALSDAARRDGSAAWIARPPKEPLTVVIATTQLAEATVRRAMKTLAALSTLANGLIEAK